MSITRQLRFALKRGEVRTADFRGSKHIVVPCVMLAEGVLHASNAEVNELVLASEFSKRLASWNGRPVMDDHPMIDGVAVSANSPKVLEGRQLGAVYNVRVDGKKLKGEIWFDPELVAAAGSDILTRINSGEMTEVSVGVTVEVDETSGEHNGSSYAAIWRNISPDHLAVLPAGKPGACDLEMGCGAPRVAGGPGSGVRGHTTDRPEHETPGKHTTWKAYNEEYMAHQNILSHDAKTGEPIITQSKTTGLVSDSHTGRSYFPSSKNEATTKHAIEKFKSMTSMKTASFRTNMIRKEKGKFVLYTKDGSKKLGTHATHEQAVAQEQAIEISKHAAARSAAGGGARMKIKEKLTALAAAFTARAAEAEEGLSSEDGINDLRNDLWNQLYAAVPAFGGIVDIFPASMKVVYSQMQVSEEGSFPSTSCLYQVSYSMNGDEPVLGDDHVEVEQVTEYEPVSEPAGEEGESMTIASAISGKLSRLAAGYGSMAKKADAASSAAQEASEMAGKEDTPEAHDSAADAHTNAALTHGQAAMAAKQAGNGTAQVAHTDKKAEHEQMAAQHSDKAIEAQKETAPTSAENGTKKTAAAHGCACGKTASRAASGGEMTKKEIVARILSHKESPFKAEDAAQLEGFSEARLTEIETRFASSKETTTTASASSSITREQVLELFPDIATVVSEHQAREASRRGELVTALKTLNAFTEDELKAMPLPQLEKTAAAVQAAAPRSPMNVKPKVDFSGLGAPRSASADPEAVPAPPSLKDRLAAARGITDKSKAS